MFKAQFHVTVITQIDKSVVYFIVRGNVKFCVTNTNPYTKFDMKSFCQGTRHNSW